MADTNEPIEGGHFNIKMEGVKAVILFPALTTPCIVDKNGKMTVIIAVHEKGFTKLQKLTNNRLVEDNFVPVEAAAKLHSHLYLTEWGDNYQDTPKDADQHLSHFQEVTANRNLIYLSYLNARKQYEQDKFKCWYLGQFTQKLVSPMHIYTDGRKAPFGVIAEAARQMYTHYDYNHLFQMEFTDFIIANQYLKDPAAKSLFELVWVYGDKAGLVAEDYTYEKPGDTLLLQNFKENHNMTEGSPLLEENVDAAPRRVAENTQVKDLNMYRLLDTGSHVPTSSRADQDPPGSAIHDKLPAMRQKGAHLLFSRHPVFFCAKDALTVGTVADLHVGSRQALFKLTKCQVIPGASLSDSPYIGRTSHEYLESTRYLLTEIARQSDMFVIAGDIFDHDRNLYPKNCAKNIKKTKDLWDYVDFKTNEDRGDWYPKHIDGVLMLELILSHYDTAKTPLFFITGNHEGYREPYGISPRIPVKGKVNDGIPSDHNLTIYEATLLYGEKYSVCKWNPLNLNFATSTYNWLFHTFTPWRDIVVSHHNTTYILLGWGNTEDFIGSTAQGGTTLPRATGAVNTEQLTLLRHATGQSGKKVLFSHFTHICYEQPMPLETEKGTHNNQSIVIGPSRLEKAVKTLPVLLPSLPPSAYCPTNIGAYCMNLKEVYALLASNRIQYAVSGHAHRGCVYTFKGAAVEGYSVLGREETITYPVGPVPAPGAPRVERVSLPANSAAVVVCGSAGPMSTLNMRGELAGWGLDSPQGMVFDPANNEARVVRSYHRPRLAAVAGAIQDIKGIFPFDDEGWFSTYTETGTTLWKGHFTLDLNKAWIKAFEGVPFQYLKIHAVICGKGDKAQSDCFILTVKEISGKQVTFAEKASKFMEFLESTSDKENDSPMSFFMSMHFSDAYVYNKKMISLYDLSTPWCFPITIKYTNILQRPYFVIKKTELPDYDYYKKFFEYQQ